MRGFIPPVDSEEIMFYKKAYSLCERAEKTGRKVFSAFLDLRQKELFISRFNKFGSLKLSFYAGYAGDFERCIACVHTEYDEPLDYDYPICVLHSYLYDGEELTHRDFLGSLMGLMIKRDYIGDILVSDSECFIVCHTNMASIIKEELRTVKHSSTSFEEWYESVEYTRPIRQKKDVTVASLRLDAVLSAVLNASRNETSRMIKQGNVAVNHLTAKKSDFEMFDGDVISVRGKGKYKIFCSGGKSKKDRLFITYIKY